MARPGIEQRTKSKRDEEIITEGKSIPITNAGGVQLLLPMANLETVRDGRGGIFTWVPKEPIVEFNMLYFRAGATRGFHYHPCFIEYLLVVDGTGTLVIREDLHAGRESEVFLHLSRGVCTRTEKNVYHTVYAITDLIVVAMLTELWSKSDPPIVRLPS